MSKGVKACEYFLKLLKDWVVYAFDVEGQSGGLLTIWNPKTCNLAPFKMTDGNLLEGRIQGFKDVIKLKHLCPLQGYKIFLGKS